MPGPHQSFKRVAVERGGFGQEPAFNPSSSLYREDAHGRESVYYNTTFGSGEVSEFAYPKAYIAHKGLSLGAGYPIFFPVCSLADAS
jgi:hypothetical protein